jgi:6-phosphogluconate dehydrogenase (decarboxylating)
MMNVPVWGRRCRIARRVGVGGGPITGRCSISGEVRWREHRGHRGGFAPFLTAVRYGRFESRGAARFADKVQSLQRQGFGGDDEKKA